MSYHEKIIMPRQNICKILLAAINLVLFALSIAYMLIGAYVSTKKDTYLPDFHPQHQWEPLTLVIIGAILATFSCLGCHAATAESRILMATYLTTMTILTIAASSISAIVYTNRNVIHHEVEMLLQDRVNTYGLENAHHRHGFDSLQKELQCCGVHDFTDWLRNAYLEASAAVPDSCCHRTTENCGHDAVAQPVNMASRVINTNGCLPVLDNLMTQTVRIAAAIGVLAGMLFILTIFTTTLAECGRKPAPIVEQDEPVLLEM